jgi:V8-like Glu-specific endopeptidase
MGIVADTFRGNSGGPVYDREHGQCVTGILLLGAPDTGVRRTVNWKEHERVVPISAIMDEIRATAPQIESQLTIEKQ